MLLLLLLLVACRCPPSLLTQANNFFQAPLSLPQLVWIAGRTLERVVTCPFCPLAVGGTNAACLRLGLQLGIRRWSIRGQRVFFFPLRHWSGSLLGGRIFRGLHNGIQLTTARRAWRTLRLPHLRHPRLVRWLGSEDCPGRRGICGPSMQPSFEISARSTWLCETHDDAG